MSLRASGLRNSLKFEMVAVTVARAERDRGVLATLLRALLKKDDRGSGRLQEYVSWTSPDVHNRLNYQTRYAMKTQRMW